MRPLEQPDRHDGDDEHDDDEHERDDYPTGMSGAGSTTTSRMTEKGRTGMLRRTLTLGASKQ